MNVLALTLALALAQPEPDPVARPANVAALQQAVDEMLPSVAKVMGVTPKRVEVRVLTKSAAMRKLRDPMRSILSRDSIERFATAFKLIRLLGPATDLTRAAADGLTRNVGGFYDSADHVLFLRDDQPAVMQKLIIPHELAHALQDQKVGLEELLRSAKTEDAHMAMLAAVEGNAEAVAEKVMLSAAGDAKARRKLMAEFMDAAISGVVNEDDVSPYLTLQGHFPYEAGAALVKAVATRSDPTGVSLLARVPASTAQVLDPALYKKAEQPKTGTIGLVKLLPGSESVFETVVGRANIELLGVGVGKGWRGDWLEVAKVGKTACAAWVVAFSTPDQARRFANIYAEWSGVAPNTRQGAPNGRILGVSHRGSVAVVLEQVPEGNADAVEEAARQALH